MTNNKWRNTVFCSFPCRLDVFIASWLSKQSRNTWQKAIKNRQVSVNDIVVTEIRQLLSVGDCVKIIKFPEPRPSILRPVSKKLDIVYEDDSLIVINKPANLCVHPATGNFDSEACLVHYLLAHSPKKLSHIDTNRPGIIHRLDKDTSGLLLVAKTDESHNFLVKELEVRNITRLYLALVFGCLTLPQKLVNKASRDPKHRLRMSIHETGRTMITDIYPIANNSLKGGKSRSLIACRIHTGRTHQIRLQLSYLGYPVIGDRVYGNHTRTVSDRQCLHAYSLSFNHPVTQQKMSFVSSIPQDISDTINSQNIDLSNKQLQERIDISLVKLRSLKTPDIESLA